MAVLKAIVLLCGLLSYGSSGPIPKNVLDKKGPFSIEEVALGKLRVATYSGKWISDFEIEYLDKPTGNVMVLNVPKNKTQIVLENAVLKKYNTTTYSFSPDRQFVLISYDEQTVFRHSKLSKYVIYSVKDKKYYDVSNDYLQIAQWGPKRNNIAYIKDNNIYVMLNFTGKIEPVQITNDGKSGSVFNGISDWVYEEEILGSTEAFWFSPEGDRLAFITLFESGVKKESIPEYGEPRDMKRQYTKQIDISYPKAGSTNPTYELRYVNLKDPKKVKVLLKQSPGVEIFHGLNWPSNDIIVFLRTNRVQNKSITTGIIPEKEMIGDFFKNNNSKGWANTNLITVSQDLNRIINIEGIPVAKQGNFKHLVLYRGEDITTPEPLTDGLMEVIKIVHWDEQKQLIYYAASEEKSATATQIYVVSEDKKKKSTCLTCGIRTPEGHYCKDAAADFSKNSTYVIVTCHGPNPRVDYLFKNQIPLGNPLAVLEGNEKLRIALKEKIFPDVMNLTVDVPGPFKADVRLLLPPNMDRSGKTKYPMLIYVYGGPASKNIHDAFKLDWGLYMSTNLSVIYGMIDGRNTLRKGENMLFAGYRALGTVEMEDQINVTRTLQKTYPFIDSTRTAIWGWSYGGYATTKILELDTQNIFKCGVAVAPVADWMYYDSMYTERYMGLPQENKKGYETSSVLKDVSNLRKKQYFLIHGNADDNVHYQNAMMIAKVLERNNIPFESMSYPDEDHSLRNVRPHLYYTMSRFWKKCFNLPAQV